MTSDDVTIDFVMTLFACRHVFMFLYGYPSFIASYAANYCSNTMQRITSSSLSTSSSQQQQQQLARMHEISNNHQQTPATASTCCAH